MQLPGRPVTFSEVLPASATSTRGQASTRLRRQPTLTLSSRLSTSSSVSFSEVDPWCKGGSESHLRAYFHSVAMQCPAPPSRNSLSIGLAMKWIQRSNMALQKCTQAAAAHGAHLAEQGIAEGCHGFGDRGPPNLHAACSMVCEGLVDAAPPEASAMWSACCLMSHPWHQPWHQPVPGICAQPATPHSTIRHLLVAKRLKRLLQGLVEERCTAKV